MKKQILTMVMTVAVSLSVFAESPKNKGENELSRAERKELREKEAIEDAILMKELLESRQWVLEADQLRDRNGNTGLFNSSINFVGVDGDDAVIQLGVSDEIGLNGVGGITVEGKLSKYEVKQGRKASSGINLVLAVNSSAVGPSSIYFYVSPDGNASATISTVEGDRLTYSGTIVPLDESIAFKGSTSF